MDELAYTITQPTPRSDLRPSERARDVQWLAAPSPNPRWRPPNSFPARWCRRGVNPSIAAWQAERERTHRAREDLLEQLQQRRADDDERKERQQDRAERRFAPVALRRFVSTQSNPPAGARARFRRTAFEGSETLPRLVTLPSYFWPRSDCFRGWPCRDTRPTRIHQAAIFRQRVRDWLAAVAPASACGRCLASLRQRIRRRGRERSARAEGGRVSPSIDGGG